ncbi:MAG: hypothetical protein IT186_12680 [Acidobacteria bacterium]|nr:hypothetical protein [Acidobacteriota bacterium]
MRELTDALPECRCQGDGRTLAAEAVGRVAGGAVVKSQSSIEEVEALESALLDELTDATPEDLLRLAAELQAARQRREELQEAIRFVTRSERWRGMQNRHAELCEEAARNEALVLYHLQGVSRALQALAATGPELNDIARQSRELGCELMAPMSASLRTKNRGAWLERIQSIASERGSAFEGVDTPVSVTFWVRERSQR